MATTSQQLLELLKKKTGATTYKVHQLVGVSRPTPYNWEHGSAQMNPRAVMKVCQIIGQDPGPYLMEIALEHAKGDKPKGRPRKEKGYTNTLLLLAIFGITSAAMWLNTVTPATYYASKRNRAQRLAACTSAA